MYVDQDELLGRIPILKLLFNNLVLRATSVYRTRLAQLYRSNRAINDYKIILDDMIGEYIRLEKTIHYATFCRRLLYLFTRKL